MESAVQHTWRKNWKGEFMKKKVKKAYEKPKVTRITLDAKTAVLGFCKTTNSIGPGGNSCQWFGGSACSAAGS